jgi:glycosyltransferase involved in cell wall biosynthesis
MPFVSVIIPTFNRSSVIIRAINSVLNQSNKDFELIVVDDGSTDETELLLAPLIDSGSIKYFKRENRGVSTARNFGVEKSSGEWVSFLDSDDEWLHNKLQEQLDFLKNNSGLCIVYGQEIWLRNGTRVNQRAVHQKFGGQIFDKCVQQCFIAPSSVMIKANVFHEMGGFDQEFVVCEDYDLWLKISSLYEVGYISNPIIIKHGGHDDQLSTKYVAMDMWRLRSLCRILKIRNLSVEDKENVIETIKRKGAILKLGYLKYENAKGVEEVENILQMLLGKED